MLPDFTDEGGLPPGIHRATWAEFADRFATFQKSDQRTRIGERLEALYHDVQASGVVRRLLIAGSYVTSKPIPNDFDALLVLEPAIVDQELRPFQYNLISRRMARKVFGGDVFSALEGSVALAEYLEFFQTTRDGDRMGIVEIVL